MWRISPAAVGSTLRGHLLKKAFKLICAVIPEEVPQELNHGLTEECYSLSLVVVLEDAEEEGEDLVGLITH